VQNEPASGGTGLQIAILIFAVVFLAYPLRKYVGPLVGLDEQSGKVVGRLFIFIPAIALLIFVPAWRRFCLECLRVPIATERRSELVFVATAQAVIPLAIGGATVLWYWTMGGEMALARRLGEQRPVDVELSTALSAEGIVFGLLLAGLVGPVVEELFFRGLLYRAWEAQMGWFWSMIATSAVFAAYHPVPFAAFTGSILFTAVMLRTGSIRSAILVHAVGNMVLWPPLLGQFYFRTAGRQTGEILLWPYHLAAFALFMVALPIYVWMSRPVAVIEQELSEESQPARC
jgi:membrane protease YdiL (CAAX protease family)